MIKYDYTQELCAASHYFCWMPVAYERADGSEEPYRKAGMACNLIEQGKCKIKKEECYIYQKAPDVVDEKDAWRLLEKKL